MPLGGGTSLASPTVLEHGSDELRDRVLRPTLIGEVRWCQLFSEPGAGSDLAGLATSAVLDGDEWVVNGQKVWTTSAHHADLAMLLARTDHGVPKHDGLSYFVLPMHQAGVEVRPIRQMNRHSSFNEVFLTDARVPAAGGARGSGDRSSAGEGRQPGPGRGSGDRPAASQAWRYLFAAARARLISSLESRSARAWRLS